MENKGLMSHLEVKIIVIFLMTGFLYLTNNPTFSQAKTYCNPVSIDYGYSPSI